jgi:hypothetical protein
MHRSVVTIVSAIALTLGIASAVQAADCTVFEKKSMHLDWQRDSSDRPQVDKPLRVAKDDCVKGAANTLDIYYFQQVFPNDSFSSLGEVEDRLKAVRGVMELRKKMSAASIDQSIALIEQADKDSRVNVTKK